MVGLVNAAWTSSLVLVSTLIGAYTVIGISKQPSLHYATLGSTIQIILQQSKLMSSSILMLDELRIRSHSAFLSSC